jgi:Carboxypeptidase regulatory-like domain
MALHPAKPACLFVLLVLLGTAAAQPIAAPAPQGAKIVGTVLDTNGGVVSNASIVLEGPSAAGRESAIASGNGFFQFQNLESGVPYRVIVSAPDFADWTSPEIVLQPGQYFILGNVTLRLSTVQVTVAALTEDQMATQQVRSEETQRVLGVIPNFYVNYDRNPAPLSARLKFQLACRALIDPVTMAGFVLNAGFYQAAGFPDYDGGVKGYGQRLGATFAGGYANIMIGDAMLPSLLHQDPRYFYQGTGTTKSRWLHAISTPLITHGDNGRNEFNFSGIGGDLASGAIANAYYPARERGDGLVFRSALIGAGGRVANGIIQEFVLHRFARHGQNSADVNR